MYVADIGRFRRAHSIPRNTVRTGGETRRPANAEAVWRPAKGAAVAPASARPTDRLRGPSGRGRHPRGRAVHGFDLEAVRVGNGQFHSGPTAGSAGPRRRGGPDNCRRGGSPIDRPNLAWTGGHVAVHVEAAPMASTWADTPISVGLTWTDRPQCAVRGTSAGRWSRVSNLSRYVNRGQIRR